MARELRYNLEVEESALLNANPQEFYAKAYLDSDIVNNYRTFPGIKSKTKVATVLFGSLLKESGCSWESGTSNLTAVEIDVCAVSAMAAVCQFEIEQSFLSLQMAAGSNADFSTITFMSHYWAEMANEIKEEIELIRWQGDTAGSFSDEEEFLALCDGYEKKLEAGVTGVTATVNGTVDGSAATFKVNVTRKGAIESVEVLTPGDYSAAPTTLTLAGVGAGTGATFTVVTSGSTPNIVVDSITVTAGGKNYPTRVVGVTGTALSVSNILTEMAKAFTAIPKRIRKRKDLLRWYIDPVAADLYRQATAANNNVAYITKALDLTYLDIKLVVCDGMSADKMVITRWTNMGYAFDGAGDGEQLEAVNLRKTVAEPVIRTRADLKLGFHIFNNEEIVYYR
jgi:hypothetical protein